MNTKRLHTIVIFTVLVYSMLSLAWAQQKQTNMHVDNKPRTLAYPLSLPIGSQFRIDSSYEFSSGEFDVNLNSSALLTLDGKTDDGRLIWRSDNGTTKVNKSAFNVAGFTESQSLAVSTLMKTFLEAAAAIELHIFSDASGYPVDIVDAQAFSERLQHVIIDVRSSESVKTLYNESFKDPDTVLHSTLDAIFESLVKPDKNAFLATILRDYRNAFRFVGSELYQDTDSVVGYTNYVEGFDNFFELAARLTILNPDAYSEPVKLSFTESYSDEQLDKIKMAMSDYMSSRQSQVTKEQYLSALDRVDQVRLIRTGEKHFDRVTGMPVYVEISEVNNYFNAEEVSNMRMTFTPVNTPSLAANKDVF